MRENVALAHHIGSLSCGCSSVPSHPLISNASSVIVKQINVGYSVEGAACSVIGDREVLLREDACDAHGNFMVDE